MNWHGALTFLEGADLVSDGLVSCVHCQGELPSSGEGIGRDHTHYHDDDRQKPSIEYATPTAATEAWRQREKRERRGESGRRGGESGSEEEEERAEEGMRM